jgi:hypothetical protein
MVFNGYVPIARSKGQTCKSSSSKLHSTSTNEDAVGTVVAEKYLYLKQDIPCKGIMPCKGIIINNQVIFWGRHEQIY